MAKVPSEELIRASELYALERLCTLIPSEYDKGLTQWDSRAGKCRYTPKGCTPSATNPLSQLTFTSSGMPADFPVDHPKFGNIWQHYVPDMYVMKSTSTSGGRPICARGNSLVYQWCQYPQTRGGGEQIPGLTTVPKFRYQIVNGEETCVIPEEYCALHNYNYDPIKMECIKPIGLEIADFFGIGQFIQYMNSRGYERPLKLDADTLFAISEASDSRLKDQIQIRVRDYAGPGLHLYSFTWKPWVVQLYGKHGPDVGFIADTLPRNWVEVDGHGYKNIVVARTNKKIQDFYRSKG